MTKLQRLKIVLEKYDHMAVAFSGGVDSTLLAKAAFEVFGDKALAITIHSNMHASSEIESSKELAKSIGIKHIIKKVDAFTIPNFIENGPLRCYHCKKAIFNTIKNIAKEEGMTILADGTNSDDMMDYRPGLKALEELSVVSPLKDANLNKADIREISKFYHLPTWSKAAFACLATRIPTGEEITEDQLRKIEKGEAYLEALGFIQYRVRCHGDLVRLEVGPEERDKFFDLDVLDRITETFKAIGFRYVTLDLLGYKQGSMNHV